jgi:hypothetical protein
MLYEASADLCLKHNMGFSEVSRCAGRIKSKQREPGLRVYLILSEFLQRALSIK